MTIREKILEFDKENYYDDFTDMTIGNKFKHYLLSNLLSSKMLKLDLSLKGNKTVITFTDPFYYFYDIPFEDVELIVFREELGIEHYTDHIKVFLKEFFPLKTCPGGPSYQYFIKNLK